MAPVAAGAQEPTPTEPAAPVAASGTIDLVDRPAWSRPVDRLDFRVAVTGDPAATAIQVEVFSSLDSVEELEESDTEDVGVRLSRTPPVPVAELPAGPDGTRIVTVPVSNEPVDFLTTQLVEPGVHPVVLSLLGPGGEVLDEVRTPVVRLGDEQLDWDAPSLAVLLDVDASPTLQPDGDRSIAAADLRSLTRTGAVLAAHGDLDLTVAVAPDTVDALRTSDDPSAEGVLDALDGADALAAPYLPLPVAALVEDGLEGLVEPIVARGRAVLTDQVGPELRDEVWPGETAIGGAGARILADLGYRHVVVPAPPDPDVDAEELAPLADAGPRPLRGAAELDALVADPALSSELASPLPDRPDGAHLALARLLLRPAPDPDDRGTRTTDDDVAATVLVRPGPLAEQSTLAGLLQLLDDPESPVRIGGLDLLDGSAVDEDPVTWSAATSPALDGIAGRVLAVAGRLDSYAAMVADRSPVADDLRLQIATAVAAGTDPSAREAAVTAVESAVRTGFEAVHLSGQTDLNLTSRRGTLPVTVENRNPFEVDVLVRVRSDRLAFPGGSGGEVAIPLTIAEGEQRRIDVPVEARATGSVPVFVELRAPDDRTRLDDLRLNVRSTAISGVGLVISAGAILVLVTWWIRHSRAVRRAAGAGSGGEAMR